jgi:hypothetical protein
MSYFAFVTSVLIGIGSISYAYAGHGFGLVARAMLFLWGRCGCSPAGSAGSGFRPSPCDPGLPGGIWSVDRAFPRLDDLGFVGRLLAWDLTDFMRRLRLAPLMDDLRALERRHLTRLTIVLLLGMRLPASPCSSAWNSPSSGSCC